MKLPAQQMHELTDAQLNFERLQQKGVVDTTALAAGAAAANVGTLGGALAGTLPNPTLAVGTVLQLLSTGTTRKISFGSGTLVWPGATKFSNTDTPAHGLGVVPVFYAAWPNGTAAGPTAFWMNTQAAATSTQLSLFGITSLGGVVAASTGGPYLWMAIG